jgi:hypothetical protein
MLAPGQALSATARRGSLGARGLPSIAAAPRFMAGSRPLPSSSGRPETRADTGSPRRDRPACRRPRARPRSAAWLDELRAPPRLCRPRRSSRVLVRVQEALPLLGLDPHLHPDRQHAPPSPDRMGIVRFHASRAHGAAIERALLPSIAQASPRLEEGRSRARGWLPRARSSPASDRPEAPLERSLVPVRRACSDRPAHARRVADPLFADDDEGTIRRDRQGVVGPLGRAGCPRQTRSRNRSRNRPAETAIATRQLGGAFSRAGRLRRSATAAPRVTRPRSSTST